MRFLSGLWFQPFKATKAHWSSPRSPLRQSDSRTLSLKWASMFTLFKLCLIKVKNSNCTVEQHPSIQASYILVNSMLKLLQGRSSNAWLHIATKHVQNMHLSSIQASYILELKLLQRGSCSLLGCALPTNIHLSTIQNGEHQCSNSSKTDKK